MPCMCGDLYCGSCGPAQGNVRCSVCGEWAEEHGEHEATAMAESADAVIGFLKSLANGITPIDYIILRKRALELLREIKPECEHDDGRCSEEARAQAEAEYEWEQEMEKHEEAIKHLLDEPHWRREED
jgi:hypothetical protein